MDVEVVLKKEKKERKEKRQKTEDVEIVAELKKEKKEKKEKKSKTETVEPAVVEEVKQKKAKKEKKEVKEVKTGTTVTQSSSTWSYALSRPSAPTAQETSAFLTTHNITLVDSPTLGTTSPVLSFSQLTVPASLAKALSVFPAPTPIQSVSWPVAMQGTDLVGIAKTGSGKTLSFGLPALLHVHNLLNATPKLTHALILSPTRELAMQIQDQIQKFGQPLNITSLCIYGGVPKHDQIRQLSSGANIVIATPGRLMDLANDAHITLSTVSFFVLDEADRMLDLGFEQDIIKIVAMIKEKEQRQTLMFSATWPQSIQKLSGKYLTSPARITVGSTDLSANTSITQIVEVLDNLSKDKRLLQLLTTYHSTRKNRVLVFCLYKKEVARVEQMLQRQGYNAMGISGDVSQDLRSKAIADFRSGACPLLIATDVAARGLDIPNVEYVINYTYPLTTEEYCHRIGRTGRAGATGTSHTFFTVLDKTHSGALINVLKQAGQKVPDTLMAFGTTVKRKLDTNYGAFARDLDLSVKATKITFGSDDE